MRPVSRATIATLFGLPVALCTPFGLDMFGLALPVSPKPHPDMRVMAVAEAKRARKAAARLAAMR